MRSESKTTNKGASAFYSIARNTNDIDRVKAALAAGANAIEPDVHYDIEQQDYVVCHNLFSNTDLRFTSYLQELTSVLRHGHKLALIAFDLKPTPRNIFEDILGTGSYLRFKIDRLLHVVRSALSNTHPEIAILFTVSTDEGIEMLLKASTLRHNEAIGVDQGVEADRAQELFNRRKDLCVCYANGTSSTPFTDPRNYLKDIRRAQELQRQGIFSLVYTWATNTKEQQTFYLFSNRSHPIDGLIVGSIDGGSAEEMSLLSRMIATRTDLYRLAKPGASQFVRRQLAPVQPVDHKLLTPGSLLQTIW